MSSNTQADKKATDETESIATNFDQIATELRDDETDTDLEETMATFADGMADVLGRVSELEERVDELERDLEETRTKVRDERGRTRHEIAKTRQDLEEVRETVSQGAEPGVQTEGTTVQSAAVEPQTDLGSMVQMPDSLREDCSANVRRALFVASDLEDYTTSCPAGRVIKSSELRRVLAAGTDCNGHTQTVARVIDLLDRTGGDGTTVVERNSERRLVFEQDLVERLSALTSQPHGGDGRTVQAV
jgi:hypothetical protein